MVRCLAHVAIYIERGEASASDIRHALENRLGNYVVLPLNWKALLRDVLKYDPDIEKTEDGMYLLRSAAEIEA